MTKKTRRGHKIHRTHKKYRHNKRHTRRHLYRKRRQIIPLPGSKGVPIFSIPEKNNSQKIIINQSNKQSGNMIPGSRNM